jgi:hypothetical protein
VAAENEKGWSPSGPCFIIKRESLSFSYRNIQKYFLLFRIFLYSIISLFYGTIGEKKNSVTNNYFILVSARNDHWRPVGIAKTVQKQCTGK